MRTFIATFGTLIIMLSPGYGIAHTRAAPRDGVQIEIVSENGAGFLSIPHRAFWKNGTWNIKNYLEARRGENYGIIVHNNTPERVGVVIAVDGRNILTGEKSDLKNTEAMYLVNAYDSGQYDGWRTSSDTIHKFYFTDVPDSYAMRTFNDTSAMGVIAVAVYREKPQPVVTYRMKNLEKESAPSSRADDKAGMKQSRDESAGTGFGDEGYSLVQWVDFVSVPTPIQKVFIKYEWRDVLVRKGIIKVEPEPQNRFWDEPKYAPFPPDYVRE
jgi:hypothetical protein